MLYKIVNPHRAICPRFDHDLMLQLFVVVTLRIREIIIWPIFVLVALKSSLWRRLIHVATILLVQVYPSMRICFESLKHISPCIHGINYLWLILTID